MKTYLQENYKEEIPAWLANHKKGRKVDVKQALQSRIVYYPGSGNDGQPVHTFVSAHTAHVFFYVDYGLSKEDIQKQIAETGPRGYHTLDVIDVTEKELAPKGWRPHITLSPDKVRYSGRRDGIEPYCLLFIFERNEGYTDEHGAERFAVFFLFGDGIACYDALFGNKNAIDPFCVILQDHGFGGNYDKFGKGGLMEQIAINSDSFPELILAAVGDSTEVWNGYTQIDDVPYVIGGMHRNHRYLFKHNA